MIYIYHTLLFLFLTDPVTCAVFTRDSQCILSASEDIIRLMDKETGELLSEYTGHKTKNYIIESCVSLKDNFVFSGSADGNMWCWELLSSKCFKMFSHAPEKVIHSVAAHPTKEVYCTAAGGCIYLWSENPPGNFMSVLLSDLLQHSINRTNFKETSSL